MPATPNIRSLLIGALLLYSLRCADYPVPVRAHSLDYLELHDPSGWLLRIDGDGGGRLVCSSMPGRKVVYLPATFRLGQTEKRIQKCHAGLNITPTNCLRAVYYTINTNDTYVCYCPEASWAKAYFDLAFSEIRRAPSKRKDRRMLQKAWMMAPPIVAMEN